MAARRWSALSVVAVGVLALTGCAFGGGGSDSGIPHDAASGGQTLAELRESFESIPGITVSDIAGGDKPNVKGNTGYAIGLEVEPGFAIADGAALVDFVVSSVWSVREGYMPNARIDIRVRTSSSGGFDVGAAAAQAGWVRDSTSSPKPYSTAAIDLMEDKDQGASNRERLGSWPGDVPEVPTGVTVQE
ncbi:hypothetical protein [Microbacterium sp. Leaf320]|uniref:hypothetical protein n=1 Tax=Microbacterium sp. Leaf320 TaxID=1736334 RepID=UPI0006FD6BC3|nr:hypothetical protein [Microbacterium sp. Leaf320]KQQ68536.1 hypothetical protein ASF63_00535 [Microbacterium sp. Leaf320]